VSDAAFILLAAAFFILSRIYIKVCEKV